MDESYIIIEEDNERKILLEGEDIKEAHRETERRFRHLVETPSPEADLQALREKFLKAAEELEKETAAPAALPEDAATREPESDPASAEERASRDEKAPAELPKKTTSPSPIEEQVQNLIAKYKSQRPNAGTPGPEEALGSAKSPEDQAPPKETSGPSDSSDTRTPSKEAPGPAKTPEPQRSPENPEVEVLELSDIPPESGLGPIVARPLENDLDDIEEEAPAPKTGKDSPSRSRGNWRRHLTSLLAAAAVVLLGVLWIYLIWR